MMGRPSSRASARVASQAGTRMPTFLRLICTSFGHVPRRLEDEGVRARQEAPEHAVDLVVDDGVPRDVREVRAHEGERVRPIHPLDRVEALDRVLVREVAAQAVDRVGRVRDDAAVVQRIHGALDLAWLRMGRVDGEEHRGPRTAPPRVTRFSAGVTRDCKRLLRSPPTDDAVRDRRLSRASASLRLRLGRHLGELHQRRHLPGAARDERHAARLALPRVRQAARRDRQRPRPLVALPARQGAVLRRAHLAALRRRRGARVASSRSRSTRCIVRALPGDTSARPRGIHLPRRLRPRDGARGRGVHRRGAHVPARLRSPWAARSSGC